MLREKYLGHALSHFLV